MGDRVYTFFLQYYRSTFTRSPVSVTSLLETFFRSCPGLLGVAEQGGIWEGFRAQAAWVTQTGDSKPG